MFLEGGDTAAYDSFIFGSTVGDSKPVPKAQRNSGQEEDTDLVCRGEAPHEPSQVAKEDSLRSAARERMSIAGRKPWAVDPALRVRFIVGLKKSWAGPKKRVQACGPQERVG